MQKLSPGGPGFPMKYQLPRQDRTAYHACKNVFGDSVDTVLKMYERTPVEYYTLLSEFFKYGNVEAPRLEDEGLYDTILESVRRDFTPPHKIVPLTPGAVAIHPVTFYALVRQACHTCWRPR